MVEETKKADRRSQPKRIEDALSEVTAPLLDLPQAQWHRALNRLRDLRLIDIPGPERAPALDAHPLLRECFAEQVRTQFPAAWQAGHRRLFEHLSGTALYWPHGIEGLQPLYQAVTHGCLAGLHEQARAEIYRDRILRGTGVGGNYSTFMLGTIGADLGAVACFEAGCRADLDEAWEIAERGPMPLFQADIQLTRARLFRDRAALAEARRLIEKHGYHRRDGELADAEAAAEGW